MKNYMVCLELFFQVKSMFREEKRADLWLNQVSAFSELLQHKCFMTLPSQFIIPRAKTTSKKVIKLIFFMVSTRNSFESWHFLLNHKCVAVTSEYYCFYNVLTKDQDPGPVLKTLRPHTLWEAKRTEAWQESSNNPTLGTFLKWKPSIKQWE